MATLSGYGTLLECPYNKSHRVQATAMARHLFKCRKMYPEVKFVTCPFNHAHKIAEPELKMHTATCEDRANFDMYKYCITTAAATHTSAETQEPELVYNQDVPNAPCLVQDNDDECWDDLRMPAYNPQEYCEKAKIIRKATLKTPAEKRAFYEQEMKRHRELDMKIKQEIGEDDTRSGKRSRRSRSRSRSPLLPRSRRSSSRSRRRSRSKTPARYRKRSTSGSRRRSPSKSSRSRSKSRDRRSRSNSRKSRSLERKRKRSRSRSVERPRPSPPYSRTKSYYDTYSSRTYDYGSGSSRSYGTSYDRYDYSFSSSTRYDYYGVPPSSSRYDDYRHSERSRRDNKRDSRDRDDEEHIYRRDFRD